MSIEIKHLVFKGIEKKEQILFKSFLNLAKNELEYQVVILKETNDSQDSADIVIADSLYGFSAAEGFLTGLPTIRVGNELLDDAGYIKRPVQWSEFKTELTRLDIDAVVEPQTFADQILPKNMEFAIVEMDEKPETDAGEDTDYSDADEYDYELDNLSIDYHSFTNSEFMKAADDVDDFKGEGKDGKSIKENPHTRLMISDDESGHNNSVLIIETNSLDAWEMSESVIEAEDDSDDVSTDPYDSETGYVDKTAEAELSLKLKLGSVVSPGNEFWSTDAEVYSGRQQLMFVKPERKMVYSHNEPGKWVAALRKGPITRVDMLAEWRPTNELKAFPISRLMWANTIATKTSDLASGLDEKTGYILARWPHFDLLELDNMLLKLCTLLFVRAESPHSLMQKSGYSRTVVFGLVNACHEMDILRVADEFDLDKFSEMNADEGVFGKIKDVFRT